MVISFESLVADPSEDFKFMLLECVLRFLTSGQIDLSLILAGGRFDDSC